MQSYTDAVTLVGATLALVATTGAITFGGNVTGTATNLTVSGTGGNNFVGHTVGITTFLATNVNVQSLTTGNLGTTTISGNITTAGFQTYGDAVTFTGTGSSAQTLVDTTGGITFRSTVNGNNPTIEARTNIIFAQHVNLDSLNAKITGPITSLTTISVSTAGVNTTQDQTYSGPLLLGSGAVLDSSFGNIQISSIVSTPTPNATIEADQGHINQNGPDIMTNGIVFESAFGADAANAGPNFQTINGTRNTSVATIIAAAVGFQAPVPQAQTTSLTPGEASELEELGIFVKSDSEVQEELAGQDANSIIIVDWPPIHNPAQPDRKVTPRRLDERQVTQIVRDVEKIYGKNGTNKKKITDELASAIADYRAQVNPPDGKVTPRAFAKFLATKAKPDQRANAYQLRRLSDEIQNLGLSPAETQGANQSWSYDLMPDDEGLVNDSGQSYNGWLLDVLRDLPAAK